MPGNVYGKAHNYWAEYFEREVLKTYGDSISIAKKSKGLNKFGRSNFGDTSISTVFSQGGNETYLSANSITKLTSSVASTTQIGVEGHTVDGDGNFTFVVQFVTLNGTNDVALTTPLARCSRLYNNGSVVLTGTVSARTAADVIYCQIPAGYQQSFKAATTVSSADYLGIKQLQVGVTKKTAASAEFAIEVRLKDKVFRSRDLVTASSPGASFVERFEPWLIVPSNADIRVRCVASAASTPVAASFEGVFGIVI